VSTESPRHGLHDTADPSHLVLHGAVGDSSWEVALALRDLYIQLSLKREGADGEEAPGGAESSIPREHKLLRSSRMSQRCSSRRPNVAEAVHSCYLHILNHGKGYRSYWNAHTPYPDCIPVPRSHPDGTAGTSDTWAEDQKTDLVYHYENSLQESK
jgi:hypothetical protein